nr:PREDICTED: uncharacterized protein LOC105671142 isoform X1 [Linepithema humile]
MNLKTIEVKENMWEYYTKLSSFEAKCKYCTYKVKYIFIKHLSMHVKKWHKSLSEWEQADENQKPWIYFKYAYEYTFDENILHSECLMCGEFFLTTLESTKTHLSQHSEELHDFIRDHWVMKYFIKSDDTTKFKCTICCKNITIFIDSKVSHHIIVSHPKELHLSISIKSMQKLRQNYELEDFEAKCQSCNFQFCYVNTKNFSQHVKEKHLEINNDEEACGENWQFKCFNYINSTTLQCRLCNTEHSNNRSTLKNHLFNHFSDKKEHIVDCGWVWNCCTKVGDFEIECHFCQSKISLDVPLWYFDRHIEDKHPNRLTSTQRMCDIAGSSGSQPN